MIKDLAVLTKNLKTWMATRAYSTYNPFREISDGIRPKEKDHTRSWEKAFENPTDLNLYGVNALGLV